MSYYGESRCLRGTFRHMDAKNIGQVWFWPHHLLTVCDLRGYSQMSGHPPVSILTLSILTFYHGRIFSWAHCHPEHRLHSLGCLIAISQTCPVWLKCQKQTNVSSLSHIRLFVTPWNVAYQASPPMAFSKQEYWSGLPFPSPKKVNIKKAKSIRWDI